MSSRIMAFALTGDFRADQPLTGGAKAHSGNALATSLFNPDGRLLPPMADVRPLHAPMPTGATGVVVFADGRTIWGQGFGAEGQAVGELCFNTAMTGYQEVMTDPSYARQVIAFTFPHIGNVGANDEDVEAGEAHALGAIVREVVTEPSNYRANQGFAHWMKKWGRIGIAGVDTRALTKLVRSEGPPTIAIAHSPSGEFDGCRSSAGPAGSGPGGRAMSWAATTRSGRTWSRSITGRSATSSVRWSRRARG
jgi:carbamoylphosphate synthase small subunit